MNSDKKYRVSLVVAAGLNNEIGKDGQLLWHLPKDLKFFKNTTWGHPVIMGRKTFESVGKPLAGRENIVISRQPGWNAAGVIGSDSITDALQKAEATNSKEIFIIGGANIYEQSMNIADRIFMTRVQGSFEADSFFPEIDTKEWELSDSHEFDADEKNKYPLSFQTWERKVS